jgi:hypothetical protein
MEKQVSAVVVGIIAASRASSREFNIVKSGPDCLLSTGDSIADCSGVVVGLRLPVAIGVVSSFESLRETAFLPVLCVTRYWQGVFLFAHLVH